MIASRQLSMLRFVFWFKEDCTEMIARELQAHADLKVSTEALERESEE